MCQIRAQSAIITGMSTPILATKLYRPPSRPNAVIRDRLISRLNNGLHRKLTLISAPAGFGKTTLASDWLARCNRPVAWFSLDEGDHDPSRFLAYLVASLQSIQPAVGERVLEMLQSPQRPTIDVLMTVVVNEIATMQDNFILVLDDYHITDAKVIDEAVTFLLEYLPPQLHLVIVTREDPNLPLARLRARDQLTEIRIADLRFTVDEANGFLTDVMNLQLTAKDIESLETRTEGWIAGLQLAAISIQGHHDSSDFVKSFTGSHHFVMDYLIEEVLSQQPEAIENFLLCTSVLDRMCGALCDAVMQDESINGLEALDYIAQANLFIIPLDNERRWFRYHHLFADLLRQRLQQKAGVQAPEFMSELHIRASQWYEDNDLEIEAFQHATHANDFARAERLITGKGMPLHFRGASVPILRWLNTLPTAVFEAHPSLWITHSSLLLGRGQTEGISERLQSAEGALRTYEETEEIRDLIGQVYAVRSMLSATLKKVDAIISESRVALEYLHEDNLAFRTSTLWKLGYAYQLQGKRADAIEAYQEVIARGQSSGNFIFTFLAMIGLATSQESDLQIYRAAETFRQLSELQGERPLVDGFYADLGLARIHYQWNDLDSARDHIEKSLNRVRQVDSTDRFVLVEITRARITLGQGDTDGAYNLLADLLQEVREKNYLHRLPEIAHVQVLVALRQGDISTAEYLAETHKLILEQARVALAKGDIALALDYLQSACEEYLAKQWKDKLLETLILKAIALDADDDTEQALEILGNALALAEPGGMIRVFTDEGLPIHELLSQAEQQGMMPEFIATIQAVFATELADTTNHQDLIEPLSDRELEVLALIDEGLSNQEIGDRLYLALDTVKGHNRRIYGKLQVKRRTEAISRARELGLI